ncbi:DNA photolyase, FAD-binding/Cryptochrome [Cercophora newfieldiana]|uniref:Cryptochrome DASH n=1 Tax=Cercophora newfieldiana TaxID=92897 RepID=A0AA39YPF9_9PEZI|nr:DNA photolyase, FAD-binding/Cryptochrome [Cercophora newfieldiana]
MESAKALLVVLRKDLRVHDNVVFEQAASATGSEFNILVPLYVFSAQQMDLSGFVPGGAENPYPAPRSRVGRYPRCGRHRAEFIGSAVWDLKKSLEALESGLVIRVGIIADVVRDLAKGLEKNGHPVGAVWMTSHEGTEEKADEKAVASLCEGIGAQCKIWEDEKYFIDDRDVAGEPKDLANVFTTYRKDCEPLREKPRPVLPPPKLGSLPKFPESSVIPPQGAPFVIPETEDGLRDALVKPVASILENQPKFPEGAKSAHPFKGGETYARSRLHDLIESGKMKEYKDTRNGLTGTDFSTKLSAYLSHGCITARQIHHALLGYEDGTNEAYEKVDGYGAGENEGTKAIRFELLWRDYMRLCHQKFGDTLFKLAGFKGAGAEYSAEEKKSKWKTADEKLASEDQQPDPKRIAEIIERFNAGTTGMGLIDAAQRELLHTGYVSNRARQNVASFLAKHLEIDWRYGAEWYEYLLVDYDVSSNWANWQYVSGVGNDPRGELRIFNPVKQSFDYDKKGDYVRSWVPEVGSLTKLENVFQAWTASEEDLKTARLDDNIMVTDAIRRITFVVCSRPPQSGKRPFFRRRGGRGEAARSGASGPEGAGGNDGAADNGPDGREGEQRTGVPTSSGSSAGGEENGQSPQQPTPHGPAAGHHGGGMGGYRGGGGRGGYQGQHRGGYQGRGGGYHRGNWRGYPHGMGGGAPRGGNGFRGARYGGGGFQGQGAGRGRWDAGIRQHDG